MVTLVEAAKRECGCGDGRGEEVDGVERVDGPLVGGAESVEGSVIEDIDMP